VERHAQRRARHGHLARRRVTAPRVGLATVGDCSACGSTQHELSTVLTARGDARALLVDPVAAGLRRRRAHSLVVAAVAQREQQRVEGVRVAALRAAGAVHAAPQEPRPHAPQRPLCHSRDTANPHPLIAPQPRAAIKLCGRSPRCASMSRLTHLIAAPYSGEKVANRGGKGFGWEILTRPLRDARRFPSTHCYSVPGATRTTLGFGDLSIVQGPFSVAPCAKPRFATFSITACPSSALSLSLLGTPLRPGVACPHSTQPAAGSTSVSRARPAGALTCMEAILAGWFSIIPVSVRGKSAMFASATRSEKCSNGRSSSNACGTPAHAKPQCANPGASQGGWEAVVLRVFNRYWRSLCRH
jgi:hypothetical protein